MKEIPARNMLQDNPEKAMELGWVKKFPGKAAGQRFQRGSPPSGQ